MLAHGSTIDPQATGIGPVKPCDQACQGGLAATIATDQEHPFATLQGQVQGADNKTRTVLGAVAVRHGIQLQALPTLERRGSGQVEVFPVGLKLQGIQLLQRHVGPQQIGNRAHARHQRCAHEQDHHGKGRRHGVIGPTVATDQGKHQREAGQDHAVDPVAVGPMEGIGTHHVMKVVTGTGQVLLLVQVLRPGAVQCQLLSPLDNCAVMRVQCIIRLAQLAHVRLGTAHQLLADDHHQRQPGQGRAKQGQRQPGQVAKSGQGEDRAIDDLRQVDEPDGDLLHIAAQAGQQTRTAQAFETIHIRIQHLLDQPAAQTMNKSMPKAGDEGLHAETQREQQCQQTRERKHRTFDSPLSVHQPVLDEGDDANIQHRAGRTQQQHP